MFFVYFLHFRPGYNNSIRTMPCFETIIYIITFCTSVSTSWTFWNTQRRRKRGCMAWSNSAKTNPFVLNISHWKNNYSCLCLFSVADTTPWRPYAEIGGWIMRHEFVRQNGCFTLGTKQCSTDHQRCSNEESNRLIRWVRHQRIVVVPRVSRFPVWPD